MERGAVVLFRAAQKEKNGKERKKKKKSEWGVGGGEWGAERTGGDRGVSVCGQRVPMAHAGRSSQRELTKNC